jgi:hypothetical protein
MKTGTKALIIIVITLYLSIKLYIYINNQIEKTIMVISKLIDNLIPYSNRYYTVPLNAYVTKKIDLISLLIHQGEMIKAFLVIKDVYYTILSKENKPERVTLLVDSHMRHLYIVLNIRLPYLELTHKLFFIHYYLTSYIEYLIPYIECIEPFSGLPLTVLFFVL